jgi:hypothetical protein
MRTSTLPSDRHLLDFSTEVLALPAGFRPSSLMVGAGDLEHGGTPNTQLFHQFDVFFCNAWDVNGSVQRNVDYINANYPGQKVICVVDYHKKDEVERFITLFAGCFTLIDGHGGHTPHFTIDELRRLLTEGGEAMNIYEKSESLLSVDDARFWFEKGYFPYSCASHTYLNSRIYNKNSPRYELLAEEEKEFRLKFLDKIHEMYQGVKRTTIRPELLANLDGLPLSFLQEILVSIMFDSQIHLDMKGEVRMNRRLWRDVSTVELVLKKVSVDYMEQKVASCSDEAMRERAEMITARIREELQQGQVYPPYAKYRTLMKHILSDKFEAACLKAL